MSDNNDYYSNPADNKEDNSYYKETNSYYKQDNSYYEQSYSDYQSGYGSERRTFRGYDMEIETDDTEAVNHAKTKLAMTGLMFSILGMVFSGCFGVGIALECVALNNRKQFRKLNNEQDNGCTKATLVLSIFGIIGGVLGLIGTIAMFFLPVIFSAME